MGFLNYALPFSFFRLLFFYSSLWHKSMVSPTSIFYLTRTMSFTYESMPVNRETHIMVFWLPLFYFTHLLPILSLCIWRAFSLLRCLLTIIHIGKNRKSWCGTWFGSRSHPSQALQPSWIDLSSYPKCDRLTLYGFSILERLIVCGFISH